MQNINIIDKKQRRKLVRSDLRLYLYSFMFLERRYDKDDRFKSRIFIFK